MSVIVLTYLIYLALVLRFSHGHGVRPSAAIAAAEFPDTRLKSAAPGLLRSAVE